MKRIVTIIIICILTHFANAQNFGINESNPQEKLHVSGNSLVTGRTYIGSTDTYFWRDASNRIRTSDQFYVDANSANTYFYSDNIYLGAGSGDNIYLRGNTFDWTSGGGGIINTSGNVGIGTTSPSQKLQVNGQIALNDNNTRILEGSGNAPRIQTNSGRVDVGPQNSTYCYFSTDRSQFYFSKEVRVNGHVRPYSSNSRWLGKSSNYWYATYTRYFYYHYYYNFSDERLKKNIKKLQVNIPEIMKLHAVTYNYDRDKMYGCDWKAPDHLIDSDGKNYNIGFLAQELKKVFPELVKYHKEKKAYVVNVDGLIPVLVKGMQEQQRIIEQGNNEREALKKEIADLESLIKASASTN